MKDMFFDRLRERCPVEPGTRIKAGSMSDPDPVPRGTLGTVTGGNGAQVFVKWDDGRNLMLLVGEDTWTEVRDD